MNYFQGQLKRKLEGLGNKLGWVSGWGRGVVLPQTEVFCSVRAMFLRFVKFYHLRAGEEYLTQDGKLVSFHMLALT